MKKTNEEALKTRQSILSNGLRVFARAGYRKATLEVIGKEAKLTRGAIYWHFKDKRDLFERILEQQGALMDALVESVLSAPFPAFQKLEKLMDAVIDNFYDNEAFRQFIELTWYKLDDSQFARIMDAKTAFVQNFLALMERLLGEALESGDVQPGTDIRLASFHLSCLINGFYRLYHVAPKWAQDKALTKRLFWNHLRSLAASEIPAP